MICITHENGRDLCQAALVASVEWYHDLSGRDQAALREALGVVDEGIMDLALDMLRQSTDITRAAVAANDEAIAQRDEARAAVQDLIGQRQALQRTLAKVRAALAEAELARDALRELADTQERRIEGLSAALLRTPTGGWPS